MQHSCQLEAPCTVLRQCARPSDHKVQLPSQPLSPASCPVLLQGTMTLSWRPLTGPATAQSARNCSGEPTSKAMPA